jgi:hypothetical protein
MLPESTDRPSKGGDWENTVPAKSAPAQRTSVVRFQDVYMMILLEAVNDQSPALASNSNKRIVT